MISCNHLGPHQDRQCRSLHHGRFTGCHGKDCARPEWIVVVSMSVQLEKLLKLGNLWNQSWISRISQRRWSGTICLHPHPHCHPRTSVVPDMRTAFKIGHDKSAKRCQKSKLLFWLVVSTHPKNINPTSLGHQNSSPHRVSVKELLSKKAKPWVAATNAPFWLDLGFMDWMGMDGDELQWFASIRLLNNTIQWYRYEVQFLSVHMCIIYIYR